MWRRRLIMATGHPFPPPPVLGRLLRAQPMDRSAAPYFFVCARRAAATRARIKTGRRSFRSSRLSHEKFSGSSRRERYAVGCRSRGRALRPKNNAWLATAETTASWNGLAIRNAGSGRCPVRKRSG
jgi:hypothetical protein